MATILTDIEHQIDDHLKERLPWLRKTKRRKLAKTTTALLFKPESNGMKIANALDVAAKKPRTRYQWLARGLGNDGIVVAEVMRPFIREVVEHAARNGCQPVLIIDQSQATEWPRHEMLMVSLRVGGRALPLCWRCLQTSGTIGWSVQKEVLEAVLGALPEGVVPVLMGDRFYGSPTLIRWCQDKGWGYRLRLKDIFVIEQDGGESTLRDCVARGDRQLPDVLLTGKRVKTNIGILHDKGHDDPWIVAMDCAPNEFTTRDYEMRWGTEAMFSDFKTRGFDLTKSQIRIPARLERLILNMALAMYFAVSTGMWDALGCPDGEPENGAAIEEGGSGDSPDDGKAPSEGKSGSGSENWSKLSFLQGGLRQVDQIIMNGLLLPPLWQYWTFGIA